MEELVLLIQKTYGIVGLILLTPFVFLVVLWRSYGQVRNELAQANQKVQEVQAERVADALSVHDKLSEMVAEQSALNKETNMALDRLGDVLSVLQSHGGRRS